MDPVTHSFVGAAVGESGLERASPLAVPTLILAANAPDIDLLAYLLGPYTALVLRRGWTHGPIGMLVLALLVVGVVLAYDRRVRRRRDPAADPARAGPLVGLALLGILTHPLLDWLNIYGVRWLAPFDPSWYYGDALFIADPWIWLVLGGALIAARVRKGSPRVVRAALAVVGVYIIGMVAQNIAATRLVAAELEGAYPEPVDRVLVAPVPADPFAGRIIVETATAYHFGRFDWLSTPRVWMDDGIAIVQRVNRSPEGAANSRIILAMLEEPEAKKYFFWARFPLVVIEDTADGYTVRLSDARFRDHTLIKGLAGVTIHLARDFDRTEQPRSPAGPAETLSLSPSGGQP